ncbi:MAG: DUF58 domain-containing protein [Haloferacaceae archaeon]
MIDPAFLDELDRFDVTLKRDIASRYEGEQESREVGEGLTFSDHRQYTPGDDTRLIDWKLYARTDELFIKEFEAERNVTLHVLLDTSASMDFGDGATNKYEYGAKLGLGFAYLFAEENDDFQFSTFGTDLERIDTGRSNRGELLRVIDLLNERTPGGETDFEGTLSQYASGIQSRSLVVVVSDFLGDSEAVASAAAALARNEVIFVQVLTPGELDPEATGDTIFEDAETDATVRTYFGGSQASRYRERLRDHVEEVGERCEELQVTHVLVDTGEDFFDSFARLWVG